MRSMSIVVAAVLGAFFNGAAVGRADDVPRQAVESWLARPIVGKTLPLAEVQRYCESRVVRMPPLSTVEAWEAEVERLREDVLAKVVFRGEAARWRDAACKVEWLDTIPGGPATASRSSATRPCRACGFPPCSTSPRSSTAKCPW